MPPEVIWDENRFQYEMADDIVQGIPVRVIIGSEGQTKIERILSTDPQDYLNPNCQPGQFLEYKKR